MVKHEHSFHNFILAYLNWMLQSSEQHPSQKQTGNKHIKGQWLSPRPCTITNYLITKGYLSTQFSWIEAASMWKSDNFQEEFYFNQITLIPFFTKPFTRPFPSCCKPLFQSEAKCKAIDKRMILYSHANKTEFDKKGSALHLILKVRVFGTWKWPVIYS